MLLDRGPSPRGRGSRDEPVHLRHRTRSIPAWAGEPRGWWILGRMRRVHPRVGGGASPIQRTVHPSRGPSPRGRGSPWPGRCLRAWMGSIPAWAGEPSAAVRVVAKERVHPRVGGGAKHEKGASCHGKGPSPRGRGSRLGDDVDHAHLRSIPAWAGEPGRAPATGKAPQVHPRVGGGASGDVLTTFASSRYLILGPR